MSKQSTAYDCTMIQFDTHHHDKGNISVVENMNDIPFEVKRIFYLYDVPGGENRGGHAHYKLFQLMVAASGSFDVVVDDGNIRRTFTLNRPYQGLLVEPGLWCELANFSSGSVCLVLASDFYDEPDYIRSYDNFIEYKRSK